MTPRTPGATPASVIRSTTRSRVGAVGPASTWCQGTPPGRPSGMPPASASPMRGSRNGRLRCTGPGPLGPDIASATDRDPMERHADRDPSSGTPGSTNHRTDRPYRCAWSMVCGAPTSRSSGGRSAVHTSIGTPARSASTTAAWSSTAAVPLVTTTTAGRPVASAIPRAVKPADRSSRRTCNSSRDSAATASVSGVDREPGHTTAWVTPARTHSSTSAAENAACRSPSPGT